MPTLSPGDPAPWFTLPSPSNPAYQFHTVGGHRVILSFLGSGAVEQIAAVVRQFCDRLPILAQKSVPFFGVSIDPEDVERNWGMPSPYCQFLWDLERKVSSAYGVWDERTKQYSPTTFVLDENLRVVGVFPIGSGIDHVERVMGFLETLPPMLPPMVALRQAPVLFVSNVLSVELCRQLIDLYEADGGRASGFMRQIDGKTIEVFDDEFKKRCDYALTDPEWLSKVNNLILRRVKPEIEKAFQFSITRFERHLVACYEASDRGFFNRHRDNTTAGTAHRRFAMTLNLNTGEYEGGHLRFPEYGQQLYRPEAGEAIIFSCSLLHEATPVTNGRRFALLSFFYNDEDAKLRERNMQYVAMQER